MIAISSLRILLLVATACSLPVMAATHTPRLVGETTSPLPYMEFLPDAYLANPTAARPLLIFLHGDGESGPGTDHDEMFNAMTHHGPHKEIAQHGNPIFNQQGMLILSPQITRTPFEVSRIKEFLEWAKTAYPIDRTRIYLTGLSNGAIATWFYARTYPQDAGALLPIAGGDTVADAYRLVGLPIWAFHNIDDPRFPVSTSTAWLNGIASAATDQPSDVMATYPGVASGTATAHLVNGSAWSWQLGLLPPAPANTPGFTVYPESGHDAWSVTYHNQAVWEWLADQRRPQRVRRVRLSLLRNGSASPVSGRAFQHESMVDQSNGQTVDLFAPSSLAPTEIRVEETLEPVPQ